MEDMRREGVRKTREKKDGRRPKRRARQEGNHGMGERQKEDQLTNE